MILHPWTTGEIFPLYRYGNIIFVDNDLCAYWYESKFAPLGRTYIAKKCNEELNLWVDLFYLDEIHTNLTPEEVRIYITFA